jgi:hypothetical protein
VNRIPILGSTLTFLVAATLVALAAAATPQVGIEAANSQPKPNDAFVDVPDFVFGDGESLASLKLHYLTLGKPRRGVSGAITNGVLLLHGTAGSAADLVKATRRPRQLTADLLDRRLRNRYVERADRGALQPRPVREDEDGRERL